MIGLNLLLVVVLILATAFFVATEFAVVKLRPSRVNQLVLEGKWNARAVQKVVNNLDDYLSACQLGITITALGLGWLGEPTVERLLDPIFIQLNIPNSLAHILSFFIAFFIITYLHVVVGELAPKTLAIQRAEATSLLTAKPIMYFHTVMFPFIWLLNGSARYLVRFAGLKPAKESEEAHSEEELRIILNESFQSGKINQTEFGYVNRIFKFDDLLCREIMVPRIDMVCLYLNKPLNENLKIIKEEQYTRFPVIVDDKDNIIGFINTKEFFLRYSCEPNLELRDLIHPVLTLTEATPIKTLLKKMQQQRSHMAVLVDEYGGTSGLVTIEDVLEEIVGEIRDEFDEDEVTEIEKIGENHYLVEGKVSLEKLTDLFNTEIESEGLDTIGGWLYGQNPILKIGEQLEYNNLLFIVRDKGRHRFTKIEITEKVETENN